MTHVIEFLAGYLREHGYGPTCREIQTACGMSSTSVVTYYLRKLKGADIIQWEPGKARTIQFVGRR
jgi:repressor LexA